MLHLLPSEFQRNVAAGRILMVTENSPGCCCEAVFPSNPVTEVPVIPPAIPGKALVKGKFLKYFAAVTHPAS